MEIDLRKPVDNRFSSVVVRDDDKIVLKPGEFVLAVTKETVGVNGKFCGRMDGKSSLGRLGLFIHITAGFIDPGNKLKLTLEIYNASGRSMVLYPGMPVAQVSFHSMSSTVENTYGKLKNNKYYGADRPQVSQFWKNFETNEHQQSDGVRQDNKRVGVENNS
jgi:dCTP deaminase